jgi:hypothetical protein
MRLAQNKRKETLNLTAVIHNPDSQMYCSLVSLHSYQSSIAHSLMYDGATRIIFVSLPAAATNTSSLHHCNRSSRHDSISVNSKIGRMRQNCWRIHTCLSRSCLADAARNSYQRMASSQNAPVSLLGLGAPTAHNDVPTPK